MSLFFSFLCVSVFLNSYRHSYTVLILLLDAGFCASSASSLSAAATKGYCDPGYFVKTDQSGCSACPAGTFGNQNQTKRHSESAACVPCPFATYSAAQGIDAEDKCIECAPGKRGREGMAGGASNEAAGCEDCSIGEYTNKLGQTSCTTCESGMVTNGTGQTFCSLCDAGESLLL